MQCERIASPGPCRLCGELAYLTDATGPVHPCCVLHGVEPGGKCLACAESKRLNAEEQRRRKGRGGKRRHKPGEAPV